MGDPRGFLTTERKAPTRRPVDLRLKDWREVYEEFPDRTLEEQAGRCMNCGIPFCHQGCPLGNLIPEWNDLVYRDEWREAIERLHATNNFPEFTGTLCPAPCEAACVLAINSDAVTIKQVECSSIDHAWEEGGSSPQPPADEDRQDGRGRRVGAGRARRGPAAHAGRARRHGVRAGRPDRRAAALRDPRVQDGEVPARPAAFIWCSRRSRPGLLHLEVGDAVTQQPADPVGALEDRDGVPGPRELLGRGQPGRTRADDRDLLAGLVPAAAARPSPLPTRGR